MVFHSRAGKQKERRKDEVVGVGQERQGKRKNLIRMHGEVEATASVGGGGHNNYILFLLNGKI